MASRLNIINLGQIGRTSRLSIPRSVGHGENADLSNWASQWWFRQVGCVSNLTFLLAAYTRDTSPESVLVRSFSSTFCRDCFSYTTRCSLQLFRLFVNLLVYSLARCCKIKLQTNLAFSFQDEWEHQELRAKPILERASAQKNELSIVKSSPSFITVNTKSLFWAPVRPL